MSFLRLIEQAVQPSTPASAKGVLYMDSDGRFRTLDAHGVVTIVGQRRLPNLIRNSGFWFAQRQAPATLTTYSTTTGRAISADGWAITNENASVQYQRTDTMSAPDAGLQARFFGTFQKITSAGKIVVSQCIEGSHMAPLRGCTVRVQIHMKQFVGAAPVVRLGLVQLTAAGTPDTLPATFISAFNANGSDPTLGTNLAYIAPKSGTIPDNCVISGNALTCTLSGAWQRFGGVFDVPVNCENLLLCVWSNNQIIATNGFSLSQAVLVDGPNIQDWMPDPLNIEQQRVERYYAKSFDIDTAPVQNAGANTGEARWVKVVAAATPTRSSTIPLRTRMRGVAGTVTLYNPAAANAQVRDISGALDCTASAATASDSGIYFTATGNATTAAEAHMGVHYTIDREL